MYRDPVKSAAALAALPERSRAQARTIFDFQLAVFTPYLKAGKFHYVDGDGPLGPGIRSLATHGHTPGHMSYIVESRGQSLIVLGDLVHWGAVQLPYPSASTSLDADQAAASVQRRRVLAWRQWATSGWPARLFPFRLGRVRAGDGRYFWIPATDAIPR